MSDAIDETESTGAYGQSGSLAYDDVVTPNFKKWRIKQVYDYSELHVDYTDLVNLNKQIAIARSALFKLAEEINKNDRLARDAKVAYEREFNRAVTRSQEKTESAKKARASIQCESLENDYLYYDQLTTELNRASYTLRQELEALNSAGNNLRQQLKII